MGRIFNIAIFISKVFAGAIFVPSEISTIQSALDIAVEGDTIFVSSGMYHENIVWPAINGIKLIGSGESDCIIDGASLASVIRFEEVAGLDSATILDGFTIQNGYAQGVDPYNRGGGIYVNSYNNPTIQNLIIQNNLATVGGGIYINNASPDIFQVIVSENSASSGGALALYSSGDPHIKDVIIANNSASSGGGLRIHDSSPILTNVVISGNTAPSGGGGIQMWYSSPMLSNVIINDNSSENGGGLLLFYSHPKIINTSIIANVADDGGGIYLLSSTIIVFNSILWDNFPQEIFQSDGEVSKAQILYSDIEGGFEGLGNIDEDPLFVDSENSNPMLQPISPCIDAGINMFIFESDTLLYILPEDYSGSAPDMGAIEFVCDSENFDSCGICDGNDLPGSGICDCAGVPYGGNQEDACGVCDEVIENDNDTCSGCTDPNATNYSHDATIDDGSCQYNNAPIAYDAEATSNEDKDIAIALYADDLDGDLLSFSIVDSPENGNLIIEEDSEEGYEGQFYINVIYYPFLNFNGSDNFTFVVTDGDSTSNVAHVQINILSVNDPPVLVGTFDNIEMFQYETQIIEIDIFDDIDNPLTYTAQSSDPSTASTTVIDETLIVTAITSGFAEIVVNASDGEYEIQESFDLFIILSGDIVEDGVINILDIVVAANMILADGYNEIADMNNDGYLDILDLVILINIIIYIEFESSIDFPSYNSKNLAMYKENNMIAHIESCDACHKLNNSSKNTLVYTGIICNLDHILGLIKPLNGRCSLIG